MTQETKSFLKYAGVFLAGLIIGAVMFVGETETIEVEKIVEKPVIKEVEVPNQECRKTEQNFKYCMQAIGVQGELVGISGEIFGNLDYYLNHPTALTKKVDVVEKRAKEFEQIIIKIEK